MISDDIKEIINKFYISLRSIVHPQDITPIIDGLTEFDRQQIAATTKNDGLMVGNDKLFEIHGRRTARSFASFVTHLRDSNSELVEDIIQYTRTHFQHIHRSIQNYQKEQSPPSATVRPSLATNSSSDTHSHITLDLVQGCRVTGNPTLRAIFCSVDSTLMFGCVLWCPTHIVLCFCFVCLRLVYPMLLVSLDCPFFIASSVFSRNISTILATAHSLF